MNHKSRKISFLFGLLLLILPMITFGTKHWSIDSSHQNHPSPSGLWSRMRQQFRLYYPSTHPSIQRHLRYMSRSPTYVYELKRNAEPYLYHIVNEIEKKGLPLEIALLPMIESKFNPHSTSTAGAEGLWQIMPATGRLLGLKQDPWFQGSRDVDASTQGALNHLVYLGNLFQGDWLLVLAAYNSGENRVLRAIERNKRARRSTHFWDLDLPRETREYVPKFLALVSLIKDPTKYNITLPHIANQPYFKKIEVAQKTTLRETAKSMGLKESELTKLNPGLTKSTIHPKGPFKLLVPYQTPPTHHTAIPINTIKRAEPIDVLANLRKYQIYTVKEHETLASIAQDFNTSIEKIRELNSLSTDTESLETGKILLLDLV